MNIAQLGALSKQGRVPRRPQHPFQLRVKPWTIQPCMIAPVLAGETLKNLLMQSRVVTDPIKNPLIGWWCEYYYFYVKLRDLDEREDAVAMLMDLSENMGAHNEAASAKYYHAGSSPNFVKLALKRVVEEYFRDAGDAWDDYTIDGMPAAKINLVNGLESLIDTTVLEAGTAPAGAEDEETFTKNMQAWEFARMMQLTEMDFEDYLRTFGVRTSQAEAHKPELIRYIREWSYPSNTIDPATGNPSSAVSWAIRERADKDRFFREPGFLIGVQVVRPKVYYSKQTGSISHLLNNALSWLPAVMRDDPSTSLREFAADAAPLTGNTTNGFWLDMRDLFVYGDQFVNFDLASTDAGMVALPTVGLQKRYASEVDADALFSATTAEYVRTDGITSLTIMGTQVDQT